MCFLAETAYEHTLNTKHKLGRCFNSWMSTILWDPKIHDLFKDHLYELSMYSGAGQTTMITKVSFWWSHNTQTLHWDTEWFPYYRGFLNPEVTHTPQYYTGTQNGVLTTEVSSI